MSMFDDDYTQFGNDPIQLDPIPIEDPMCRRYVLPFPLIKLPIKADKWLRGILTIQPVNVRRVPVGECGVVNQLRGTISVEIEFSADMAALGGSVYNGKWVVSQYPRFSWPPFGQPLPVLIQVKRTEIDCNRAVELIAIERSESFGHVT